jgi:hypothetical protein
MCDCDWSRGVCICLRCNMSVHGSMDVKLSVRGVSSDIPFGQFVIFSFALMRNLDPINLGTVNGSVLFISANSDSPQLGPPHAPRLHDSGAEEMDGRSPPPDQPFNTRILLLHTPFGSASATALLADAAVLRCPWGWVSPSSTPPTDVHRCRPR